MNDIVVHETQHRDQVHVHGSWTSFNIHEGVDVGGDCAERFPNEEEYEHLHNINNYETCNAVGDDVSIQSDDIDHNDVDFEHEFPDNNNDMHPEMNNEGVDDVRVHRATSDTIYIYTYIYIYIYIYLYIHILSHIYTYM